MSVLLSVLGEAARAGGSYFSQVHLENTRRQNLKEAREFQVTEKAADRAYQEGQVTDSRAHQSAVTQQSQGFQKELQGSRRADQIEDRDANNASRIESAEIKAGAGREETFSKPEVVVTADGTEIIAQHGSEGTLRERPDLGVPDKELTVAAATAKTRFDGMEVGMNDMTTLMGLNRDGSPLLSKDGEPIKGYDPTTTGAYFDSTLNSFELTNGLSSKEAQQFASAQKRVVEQLLRSATGAAAPDSEQANYLLMYGIRHGDDKSAVAMKLNAMNMAQQSIKSIFSDETFYSKTVAEQDAIQKAALDKAAADAGLSSKQPPTDRDARMEALVERWSR
jgi:hypothetical protein